MVCVAKSDSANTHTTRLNRRATVKLRGLVLAPSASDRASRSCSRYSLSLRTVTVHARDEARGSRPVRPRPSLGSWHWLGGGSAISMLSDMRRRVGSPSRVWRREHHRITSRASVAWARRTACSAVRALRGRGNLAAAATRRSASTHRRHSGHTRGSGGAT